MKHFFTQMKRTKFLVMIATIICCSFSILTVFGQSTAILSMHSQDNSSRLITFNVENTNAYPIKITTVDCHLNLIGKHDWTVLYNPTAIKSAGGTWTQGTVGIGQNGWVSAGTGTLDVTGSGVFNLTQSLSIIVPPSSTFGICISDTSIGYMTLTAGAGVNTFSAGGVNLKTGDSCGWGGATIPTIPVIYPRGFVGGIAFEKAPCTASVSVIAAAATICTGDKQVFTAIPTYGGSTPSYQWLKNGSTIAGATSVTYTTTSLTSTDSIECILTTSASCAINTTAKSNAVKTNVISATSSPTVTISANPSNTVPSGTPVTFTATQTLGGVTPVYQWRKNGIVVGTNSNTYLDSTLVTGDIITCTLTSSASCASPSTITSNGISMTVYANNYCTPVGNCSYNIIIANVTFNTLNRSSGCEGTNGFSYFNSAPNTTNVEGGKTYNLSVTTGSSYAEGVVVWIDYNQNGVFEASETVLNAFNSTFPSTYTTTVTIPTTVAGGITRMRVRSQYNSAPVNNPCGTVSYGETEDYLIFLTPAPCLPKVAVTTNVNGVSCSGDNVTFYANPTNGGASPVFQWFKNGVAITGATNASYSITSLISSDSINCRLTSNAACATANPVVMSAGIKTSIVSTTQSPTISISASPSNSVPVGTWVTFTATSTLTGATPVYQWKKNGVIVGTNSITYRDSTFANNDIVTCTLISNASCASKTTVTSSGIKMSINVSNYCIPIGSCNFSMTITNVTFNSINRTFPDCEGVNAYSLFSDPANTTTVLAGNTYTLSVTNGNQYPQGVVAWIDYNQNGAFETSEQVLSGYVSTFPNTYTNAVTIPTSVTPGLTRMRIRSAYNVAPTDNPCGTLTYGETEDYLINIYPPTCTPTINIITNNGTKVCAGDTVIITALTGFAGTAPTFQWQKNGVNINGETSGTYTTSTLSNTDSVRCIVTSNEACAAANPTAISNVIKPIVVATSTAPTIVISAAPATTVPAGTWVTFTATQTLGGSSPKYVWKKNGVVVGGNSTTYADSTFANGDVITCTLTSNAGCASIATVVSNSITMTIYTANYCKPVGNCNNSMVITNVSFENINRSFPTCEGVNGYSLFTDASNTATVQGGKSYSLSVTTGNVYAQGVTAWIDYNQNGAFETSETILNSFTNTLPATYTTSVTIPSSVSGGITRMRVRSTYNTSPTDNPCGTLTYGETEDYLVNLIPATCTPSVTITANVGGIACSGDTVTFAANLQNGGASPTYQWLKNGVAISGATASSYATKNLTSVDSFQCKIVSNAVCAITPNATSKSLKIAIVSSTQTPTVSVTASPANNVPTGTPVTFTAVTTLAGTTPVYQWKKNGAVVGTNSITYIDSTLVNGDIITCTLVSNASCASPKTITSGNLVMGVYTTNYCTPVGNCNFTMIITNVNFNTINRYSPTCEGVNAYSYFKDAANTTTVKAGSYYPLSVSTGNAYAQAVTAWIDFNQNGTFESSEIVLSNFSGTFPSTYTTNVQIPTTATSGLTRLRVRSQYNATINDPCATVTYGETEDYLINIVPATCQPTIGISAISGAVACTGDNISFSANITFGGASPSFQWYLNGNPISGATSASYTGTFATNDSIKCVLTSNAVCAITTTVESNIIKPFIVGTTKSPTISISASPATSVPTGTPVVFTAVQTLGGSTPVYQWKKNGTVVGTNSAVYTDSTLANNDVITCTLISNASCATPLVVTSGAIKMTVYNTTYCVPVGNCNYNMIISNVSFNTINRSSSACEGVNGYSYFKDATNTTTILSNTTYNLSVTTGNSYSQGVTAWIDYNQNGTFESSETVLNGYVATIPYTYNTAITVPTSATYGLTRLRIRVQYNSNVLDNPCGTINYGETEDYLINIAPATCTPTINIASVIGSTTCTGVPVTFTATTTNSGNSPTFQWYKNSAIISGATDSVFTTNALQTGDSIWCLLTSNASCAVSTPTSKSNVIVMTVNATAYTPINITCPTNITKFTASGQCNATVAYSAASVTGSPTPTVTYSIASNTNLPVGIYPVIVTATNACEVQNCSFTITVKDTTAPTFVTTVPTLILYAPSTSCSVLLNYNAPTATDNCGTKGVKIAQTAGLPTGSLFPVGITTNTFTATDSSGNTRSISGKITVRDTTRPTITCPANDTIYTNVGCIATGLSYGNPTVFDNCSVASVFNNAPDSLPIGVNTVTWTVKDPTGNTNTCKQLVTVTTNTGVSISAAPSTTIWTGSIVTFTATPTSSGASPNYQWKKNGTNTGTNSSTFTDATLANGDVITCEMQTTASACAAAGTYTSNAISIIVNSPNTQLVSGNAFIQDKLVEVAVGACGNFASSVSAPTGFHPRGAGNASSATQLGFVANPAKDNWATYVGDYFLPGTPEEGFGISVNGTNYNNNRICTVNDISGNIIKVSSTAADNGATWQGSAAGLSVTAKTYIPPGALYFVTKVTVTNTTATPIKDVYYMRNVDPDQARNTPSSTGSFNTYNSIVYQNPNTCNKALVSATSLNGSGDYLGLGSIDARAKVTRGGFDNRNAANLWKGIGVSQTGTNKYEDSAISISFNLGTLNPNQSTSFAYAYILSESDLNQALAATNLGLTVGGDSVSVISNNEVCQGSSLPIVLSNTGTFTNWVWSPATGLDTTKGTTVNTTVTAPIVYTATGTGVCGTLTVSIPLNPVEKPLPGNAGTITGSATATVGQANLVYSINPVANATTYDWTLPTGAVVSSKADSNSIKFTASLSAWCGNITVQPKNACGVGAKSSKAVCINSAFALTPVGSISSVCQGTSSVNFSYTSLQGSPSFYSIYWDTAALNAGFTNVINASIVSSPIAIAVPTGVSGGTYTGQLYVGNSISSSPGYNISIPVIAKATPTIGITASATTITAGTSVTFTASITNGGASPTYQWKKNGVNISGANSATYTTTTLVNGDIISCQLTSSDACVTASTVVSTNIAITVNVSYALTPTGSIPSVCQGTSSVNFSYTSLQGSPNFYSIYWDAAAINAGFTNVINATITSSPIAIAIPTSVAGGTYNGQLYVGNGSISSPGYSIVVPIISKVTPTIGITASATTINVGTSVTFTASITNGGASPNYQWKKNGVNISGANSASYTTTTIANGDIISCQLISSNTCVTASTIVSTTITMTVNNPYALTPSGSIPSVCQGTSSVNFNYTSLQGSPNFYSIYWDAAAINAGFTNVINATITSSPIAIAVPTSVAGGTYNGQLYVGNGSTSSPGYSIVVPIISKVTPTIGITASATTINVGTSVTFTASITNGGASPTYQWKKNGVDISGANSATYTTTTLVNGDIISCQLISSNTCVTASTVVSTAITITVNNPYALTPSGSIPSVCQGTSFVNFSYTSLQGSPNFYSIYWDAAAINAGFTNVINATITSSPIAIAVPTSVAGGTYNGQLYVGNGSISSPGYSIVVPIISKVTPTIGITASATSINAGTSVTFTASITNGGASPTYQWIKNGANISGANSDTYTTTTLTNGDIISCQLTTSNTCVTASTVASSTITMTVNTQFVISGRVVNPNNVVIPFATVSQNGGNLLSTGTTGKYSYNVTSTGNYVLKANKNNDVNKSNGVSAIDIILIQSHILNKNPLNTPYKIIAADVNNDGAVTTIDILLIKRLVLSIDTSFKGNRLWAFVDSNYTFPVPTKPFPYKDSIVIANPAKDYANQTFIGVKLGDVNTNWDNTVLGTGSTSAKPISLYYNNVVVANSSEVRIPIRVKDFNQILGMQFTLNFNSSKLQWKKVENNLLNADYGSNHSQEGKLSFIWTDEKVEAKSLPDSTVIMELVFSHQGDLLEEDLKLSSDLTAIEAWDADFKKHNIVLTAGKIAPASIDNVINTERWEVSPNPTSGKVNFNASLKTAKSVQIELTNGEGKALLKQKLNLAKGNSSTPLNLNGQGRLAAGIYYFKVSGIEASPVKQIVVY